MRPLFVLALFLVSCTIGTSGACPNPVQDACSAKAAQIVDELAKIAAARGTTSAEMTTEFMNACESQLQSDLDQTANAITRIAADGGTSKGSRP